MEMSINPSKQKKYKVLVLGVGNILMADDGFGVRVVQEMEKMALPDEVELLDGGVAGFDLLHPIQDAEKLIVIDSVLGGGEPGDIFKFTPDDIKLKRRDKLSLHEVEILEVLEMAEQLGYAPKSVFIAIQPKVMDISLDLSDEIKAKIPRVIELVMEEIETALNRSGSKQGSLEV